MFALRSVRRTDGIFRDTYDRILANNGGRKMPALTVGRFDIVVAAISRRASASCSASPVSGARTRRRPRGRFAGVAHYPASWRSGRRISSWSPR